MSKKKKRSPTGATGGGQPLYRGEYVDTVPDSADASVNGFFSGHLNDGEKYPGGLDAWFYSEDLIHVLRERSYSFVMTNPVASGIISRLVTNEVNVGLSLEALPQPALTGLTEDSSEIWSEKTEVLFDVWARNPKLCDKFGVNDFATIQKAVKWECLVVGDCLIRLHMHDKTGLPLIEVISGRRLSMSHTGIAKSHKFCDGVETDANGAHVAYWVFDSNDELVRLPAFGSKTGRRIAWVVKDSPEKDINNPRGRPLLANLLQSLSDIDKYRDSTIRKAVLNSIISVFIRRDQEKLQMHPLSSSAVRKETMTTKEAPEREFEIAKLIPGLFLQGLQPGEEPVVHGHQGVDLNFPNFYAAMIDAIAWSIEVPPEILKLGFSSNYSASQAAIAEFRKYVNKRRRTFGRGFCQPIYEDWLTASVLRDKISGPGLLKAIAGDDDELYSAWTYADWHGATLPSMNLGDHIDAIKNMRDAQMCSYTEAARMGNNASWRTVVRTQVQELKKLKTLKDLERDVFGEPLAAGGKKPIDKKKDE